MKRNIHRYISIRYQQGQALLLASVAVIAALGMGVSYFGLVALQSRLRTESVTSARIAQTQAAMAAYFVQQSRLPCPARPDLLSTNPTFGAEDTSCSNTKFGSGNSAAAMGVIPWVTLGIPQAVAMDAFGNFITYYVTYSATTTTSSNVIQLTGNITLHSTAPIALGLSPAGNQLNACSITVNDNACNKFGVYALISHGPNGYGAYMATAQVPTRRTLPDGTTNKAEFENTDQNTALASPASILGTNFDDQVAVIEPRQLTKYLDPNKILQTQVVITTQTLNALQMAILGYAVGNPGRYGTTCNSATVPIPPASTAPCLTLPQSISAIESNTSDFWGNAIAYTVGTSRLNQTSPSLRGFGQTYPTPTTFIGTSAQTDSCGNSLSSPINIAFRLRSAGPDGTPCNGDDIVVDQPISMLRTLVTNAGISLP